MSFPNLGNSLRVVEWVALIRLGGYSTLSWVRMCGPKFRPPLDNKTREDANVLPISKPFASWRALFKTNQCFLQCKLGCISTFWQPIDKPKDKFIGNYAFCKSVTYILTNFQIKKGAIAKPESPKKHPIWAAHPRTHLSTKYPPRGKVSLWYVPLLINARFRFFYFRISNC